MVFFYQANLYESTDGATVGPTGGETKTQIYPEGQARTVGHRGRGDTPPSGYRGDHRYGPQAQA